MNPFFDDTMSNGRNVASRKQIYQYLSQRHDKFFASNGTRTSVITEARGFKSHLELGFFPEFPFNAKSYHVVNGDKGKENRN